MPFPTSDFFSDLGDSRGGLHTYWAHGAGAPSSSTLAASQYVAGDLYYDTTNNVMYFCNGAGSKTTSTWVIFTGFTAAQTTALTAIAGGLPTYFGPVADQTITNTTSYAGLGWSAATEIDIQMLMPRAATLQGLSVLAETDPSAAQTYTVTVRKNAADTTITAQVTHANFATVVQDLTHTATVVAGDKIDVSIVGTATVAGDALWISLLLV